MSCATPVLPSGSFGHVPETAGHVAEIAGHDPETAGHLRPKYARCTLSDAGCLLIVFRCTCACCASVCRSMCKASPNRRADTIGAGSSGSRSDAMNRSKLTFAPGMVASTFEFTGRLRASNMHNNSTIAEPHRPCGARLGEPAAARRRFLRSRQRLSLSSSC